MLRQHGTERAGTSPLDKEHGQGVYLCAGLRAAPLPIGNEVRQPHGLAQLLGTHRGGGRDVDRHLVLHDTNRGTLPALRGTPGPRLRRRPQADRTSLLHQRRGPEVRPRLTLLDWWPPSPSPRRDRLLFRSRIGVHPTAACGRCGGSPCWVNERGVLTSIANRSLPAEPRVQSPIRLSTDAVRVAAPGSGPLPFRLTLRPRLEYPRWRTVGRTAVGYHRFGRYAHRVSLEAWCRMLSWTVRGPCASKKRGPA